MALKKDEYIKEKRSAKEVYEKWLLQIGHLKKCTKFDSDYDAFDIVYLLFPLVEVISYTLYNTGPRKYLEKLCGNKSHANLIVEAYRNGYMHNNAPYEIKYTDGVVDVPEMTGKSSDGLIPWESDDKFYSYDGNRFSIIWDKLLACIEADIKSRINAVRVDAMVECVVGKSIETKKPSKLVSYD